MSVCVCVFSFGSGFFCPSLLSCMLWFCVGRAHWYLVVVCFPGLEEARYEEFQRRAGELTWFLSLWLNESCGFGHVQQSVSNGHQTYWCLRPSGRQRFRVFGAQCSPALIKTPCSKLTPKIKGLNVPDLNMFSTKDPFRHFWIFMVYKSARSKLEVTSGSSSVLISPFFFSLTIFPFHSLIFFFFGVLCLTSHVVLFRAARVDANVFLLSLQGNPELWESQTLVSCHSSHQ